MFAPSPPMNMLAGQYSLRKFIGFVTISAFACLVVAAGLRGQIWGVAVVIALASVFLLLAMHAALFGFVILLGRLVDRWQKARARTSSPGEISA